MPPDSEKIEKSLNLYIKQLKEIKHRTSAIGLIAEGRFSTPYPATNIEFVYLQYRKILELIALSSLVANKDEYEKVEREFAKEWNAKKILKKLKTINPDFYPRPTRQIKDPKKSGHFTLESIESGYLTQDDFVELYNLSSTLIHATNPFAPEPDLEAYKSRMPGWFGKITTLLNHHTIILYGGKHMIAALMQSENNGEPHATFFAKVESPQPRPS
jgi:hypothetical protein